MRLGQSFDILGGDMPRKFFVYLFEQSLEITMLSRIRVFVSSMCLLNFQLCGAPAFRMSMSI